MKHFVPDWLISETVATNTEPLTTHTITTSTDDLSTCHTMETSTEVDDDGFIYRPQFYHLRTTYSASSALNQTPSWIVNAYCDHISQLNINILMRFVAAIAFIYLPIHITCYYLCKILTNIYTLGKYFVNVLYAIPTVLAYTVTCVNLFTISVIAVLFKTTRYRLCTFLIISFLTFLLILNNSIVYGFSVPTRDNTVPCRLPVITHTNFTNIRLIHDAKAEKCFYTDRKNAVYDAQPLNNLMALYNKFDKGINLEYVVSPYTSLDDFLDSHNLRNNISLTGQLNIYSFDNDALMSALSAFAIHVVKPDDAIYPNQIYFSDTIRFPAFNIESKHFISIDRRIGNANYKTYGKLLFSRVFNSKKIVKKCTMPFHNDIT